MPGGCEGIANGCYAFIYIIYELDSFPFSNNLQKITLIYRKPCFLLSNVI